MTASTTTRHILYRSTGAEIGEPGRYAIVLMTEHLDDGVVVDGDYARDTLVAGLTQDDLPFGPCNEHWAAAMALAAERYGIDADAWDLADPRGGDEFGGVAVWEQEG